MHEAGGGGGTRSSQVEKEKQFIGTQQLRSRCPHRPGLGQALDLHGQSTSVTKVDT